MRSRREVATSGELRPRPGLATSPRHLSCASASGIWGTALGLPVARNLPQQRKPSSNAHPACAAEAVLHPLDKGEKMPSCGSRSKGPAVPWRKPKHYGLTNLSKSPQDMRISCRCLPALKAISVSRVSVSSTPIAEAASPVSRSGKSGLNSRSLANKASYRPTAFFSASRST